MDVLTSRDIEILSSDFTHVTVRIYLDDLNYIDKQELFHMISDGELDDEEVVWLLSKKHPLIVDRALERGWSPPEYNPVYEDFDLGVMEPPTWFNWTMVAVSFIALLIMALALLG